MVWAKASQVFQLTDKNIKVWEWSVWSIPALQRGQAQARGTIWGSLPTSCLQSLGASRRTWGDPCDQMQKTHRGHQFQQSFTVNLGACLALTQLGNSSLHLSSHETLKKISASDRSVCWHRALSLSWCARVPAASKANTVSPYFWHSRTNSCDSPTCALYYTRECG